MTEDFFNRNYRKQVATQNTIRAMVNVLTPLFSIVLIEVYAVPLCCYSW